MKLLVEVTQNPVSYILEADSSGNKNLYIEGCFAQSEKKNRNGRIYPKAIMESAINKYINEWVTPNRALGELSHPENRPMVKPELASHRITSLRLEGNDVLGKALVLNTPQGQVLRGLLEGGTQLGVSTRGLGSIEERAGTTYVKDDYLITAIDAVGDPSGIDCFVNSIMESVNYTQLKDGRIVELVRDVQKKKINEEKALIIFSKFVRQLSE